MAVICGQNVHPDLGHSTRTGYNQGIWLPGLDRREILCPERLPERLWTVRGGSRTRQQNGRPVAPPHAVPAGPAGGPRSGALAPSPVRTTWLDMQHHVTIIYSFLAGLLSFLSPCVLPLVPGYVSLLSGTASQAGADPDQKTSSLLVQNSLLFILGFSAVFISLGAAASSVGAALREHQVLLSQISGIVVILFGLHLLGVIRIKALYADKRVRTATSASGVGAFVVGFAFAFGWTPCIGPVLGTILLLAASEKTLTEGLFLLTVYSAGLAVPFLLTTLALDRFTNFYRGFRRHLHTVEMVSGALMVLIGLLLLTHRFTMISAYLARIPFFNKLLL